MSGNKLIITLIVGVLVIVLQVCKPAQTTTSDASAKTAAVNPVSYEKDIRPLMLERCTPCHFPETGKKKMLDSYTATKADVNEIISRIRMSPEEAKFMPFKSKKAPLSEKEIQLFSDWLSQGMPN